MKDINIKSNIRLKAKETARKLRHNQTTVEKFLWEYLRSRRFKNIKFLRQHQIIYEYLNSKSYFIADFYCAEYKVIIEIDGEVHLKQKEKDKNRENLLETLGYRIIRFKNEEVRNNIDLVLSKIENFFIDKKYIPLLV